MLPSRRQVFQFGALSVISACAKTGEAPRGVAEFPGNDAISPQIVLGSDSAQHITELAVSLHCGATRSFSKTRFPTLISEVKSGNRAIIMTHYPRTPNEIPLGVTLLRTGDRYGEAMLALLGASASRGRSFSDVEAQNFLANAGFTFDPRITKADARQALGMARVAYDTYGMTTTPFIREIRLA